MSFKCTFAEHREQKWLEIKLESSVEMSAMEMKTKTKRTSDTLDSMPKLMGTSGIR